MNREETIKVLSILKAAYPNSYRGMTKEEANGTITIWSMQFSDMPMNVVLIALNKIISSSPFPPAISEVKDKLRGLFYEAADMLREHKYATEGYEIADGERVYMGKQLDDKTLATVNDIIRAVKPLRGMHGNEPSLNDMLHGNDTYLITDGGNTPKQN